MSKPVLDATKSESSVELKRGSLSPWRDKFNLPNLIVLFAVLFGCYAAVKTKEKRLEDGELPFRVFFMFIVGVLNVHYDTQYGSILTAPITKQRLPAWFAKPGVCELCALVSVTIRLTACYTLVTALYPLTQIFGPSTILNVNIYFMYFLDYTGCIAVIQFLTVVLALTVACVVKEEPFAAEQGAISKSSLIHLITCVWLSKIVICITRTCTYILTTPFRVCAYTFLLISNLRSVFMFFLIGCLGWPVLLIWGVNPGELDPAMYKCIQAVSEGRDEGQVVLCSTLICVWAQLNNLCVKCALFLTTIAVLSTETTCKKVTELCEQAEREIVSVSAHLVDELNSWGVRTDG